MNSLDIIGIVLKKELLLNDIHKLLKLSDNYCNFDFSLQDFQLIKGMYTDQSELYNDIIEIIRSTKYINYLLEIMPYIDDYIELFFD